MSPVSVGLRLYPHLLALQSEHPKLVIDYRFAPNADVENAIAESTVDIGLVTAKSTLADVSCTPVGQESLLLVTPAFVEHPAWDALMNLGFVDHPDGSHHANLLLGANCPEFQHSNLLPSNGSKPALKLNLSSFGCINVRGENGVVSPERRAQNSAFRSIFDSPEWVFDDSEKIPSSVKPIVGAKQTAVSDQRPARPYSFSGLLR